jgi:prevent-host-death family protein
MDFTQDIKPVTYMKTRASELLKKVNESHRPMVITQNGEAKVVVLDVETYQSMHHAMLLLKLIAQGEADVREGKLLSQAEVFARVLRS